MARLGPLLVRDLKLGDTLPECAWADVVAKCGDLVVGVASTGGKVAGKITIGYVFVQSTIDAVRAVLREHGIFDGNDEAAEPWGRDADWWRGE